MGIFDVARWDGAAWTNLELDEISGASGVWGFGSEELAHWDGSTWEVTEIDGFRRGHHAVGHRAR